MTMTIWGKKVLSLFTLEMERWTTLKLLIVFFRKVDPLVKGLFPQNLRCHMDWALFP